MIGVAGFSEIDRELYGKYVRGYYKKEEALLINELKEIEKTFINEKSEKAIELATKYTVKKMQNAFDNATMIYNELSTYFLEQTGDGTYMEECESKTPFVPSLLGEERLAEIYKEYGIPLEDEEQSEEPPLED